MRSHSRTPNRSVDNRRFARDLGNDPPLKSAKMSSMSESKSLYTRLGGYDAIAAVSENLVDRLMADQRLGRF